MAHPEYLAAALIAGIISFLSPCVLPLVPPYLIYLTGATIEHVANGEPSSSPKRAVMTSALMFVFGFSTVFVALGASASLIGGLISFVYAVHLQAWPLLISTGLPLPIYARNVWMIYRDRSRVAA